MSEHTIPPIASSNSPSLFYHSFPVLLPYPLLPLYMFIGLSLLVMLLSRISVYFLRVRCRSSLEKLSDSFSARAFPRAVELALLCFATEKHMRLFTRSDENNDKNHKTTVHCGG